jgi:GNAT superfamily N-acetyltransferase
MDGELIFRRARAEDRAAMERICAHTWDMGDYIPEVWDEWLADDEGPLLVGELDGQVVTLNKITWQPSGQIWLEGMRVDPEFRRRGISVRSLDFSLAYAREHKARVVRLSTGGQNLPVHTVVARAGMEHIGIYVLWTAEPLTGDWLQPLFLTPDQAPQVHAFLANGLVMAHTHGLYNMNWAWQELSAERVAQHLNEGQVLAQSAPDGRVAALAIVQFDVEDRHLWVSFVDGQAAAVTALAGGIRTYAAQLGAERVQVMLPDLAWLRDAFQAAGYGFGDWEGELWIFEYRLSASPPVTAEYAVTVSLPVTGPRLLVEGQG